jgi:hypothetical protein
MGQAADVVRKKLAAFNEQDAGKVRVFSPGCFGPVCPV